MAHERQLSAKKLDERWPLPYAVTFITLVSLALWSVIITAASWLII